MPSRQVGTLKFKNDFLNDFQCTKLFSRAFDNVANAALHMFVLMSTENYPVSNGK